MTKVVEGVIIVFYELYLLWVRIGWKFEICFPFGASAIEESIVIGFFTVVKAVLDTILPFYKNPILN